MANSFDSAKKDHGDQNGNYDSDDQVGSRNGAESIEKEEKETRDTLREELLENVQNFKAEPDKKILEFQEILERLITQELHAQKEGEDRWRTLDAAIRRQQMARREAAAASEKKGKKKNGV